MPAEVQRAGEWLDIGGTTKMGFGLGRIEVREATDSSVGWKWRPLTEDEKVKLINLWNASHSR